MKALDRYIATNLCPIFLFSTSILFIIISLGSDYTFWRIFFLSGAAITLVFNFTVIGKMYQRKRIFDILTNRIRENGYSKEIFLGKCPTICALSLCCYILIRIGQSKDIPYLFEQFLSKKSFAIHPDIEIEKAINQAAFGREL